MKIAFLFGLCTLGVSLAAASAPKELIQRIYEVEGRPSESVVLREVRSWRNDGSFDGLRVFQAYKNGIPTAPQVERFGQTPVRDGKGTVAVDVTREVPASEAIDLANGVAKLFSEAIQNERYPTKNSEILDLSSVQPGRFEYVYRTPHGSSSAAVDPALRSGSDEWRRQSEQMVLEKELNREAKKELLAEQGRLRMSLEADFRELAGRTAISAREAQERTARKTSPEANAEPPSLIEKERYFNAPAQARDIRDIEDLAKRSRWADVARRVADLESPRSHFSSETTKAWLASSKVASSLREYPYYDRSAMPRFQDPSLESEKLVIANFLQAAAISRPQVVEGRGTSWLRSSAMLVHAAGLAEKAGRPDRARALLAQARTIGAYFAGGSEGGSLRIARDSSGHREFLSERNGPSMSETLQSQSEQEAYSAAVDTLIREAGDSRAEPSLLGGDDLSAQSLRTTLKILGKSLGRDSDPLVKAGGFFLGYVEKASTKEDLMLTRSMVVATIDIMIGFVPPLAAIKGLYEFSSGRHWLTGDKLDAVDQGFALLAVLTFGGSSTFTKALRTMEKLTPYTTEARVAAGMANEMMAALRSSGGNFAASMIDSFRKALPAAANTDEAIRLVKMQSLVVAGRLEKLPLKTQAISLEGARSLLTVRALEGNGKYAMVALPGLLEAGRMILEPQKVQGMTWPEIRERYDLPEGPAPDRIWTVQVRPGDPLQSVKIEGRDGESVERLQILGPEMDRNFSKERRAIWDSDGKLRP